MITTDREPFWWIDHLNFERNRIKDAEQEILRLRRMLIALNPALPHEMDGNAWSEVGR